MATDWTKQTEEMVNMWTSTQQRVYGSWLETMQKVTQPEPPAWERTLSLWQTSVENMLKSQADWTKSWADQMAKQQGLPAETAEWLDQVNKMTDQFVALQTDLWKGWFEMSRSLDPARLAQDMPNKFYTEGQKATQAWQDHMQKVMDAQAEYMKQWAATAKSTK